MNMLTSELRAESHINVALDEQSKNALFLIVSSILLMSTEDFSLAWRINRRISYRNVEKTSERENFVTIASTQSYKLQNEAKRCGKQELSIMMKHFI